MRLSGEGSSYETEPGSDAPGHRSTACSPLLAKSGLDTTAVMHRLPAQRHAGENTGITPTHTILIELKGVAAGASDERVIGPATT